MEDTYSQLVGVLAFLGLRAPAEALLQAVSESDLGAMRALEEQRLLPGKNVADHGQGAKVREGGVGHFLRDLDPAVAGMCTAAMRRMLPPDMLGVFQEDSGAALALAAPSNNNTEAGHIARERHEVGVGSLDRRQRLIMDIREATRQARAQQLGSPPGNHRLPAELAHHHGHRTHGADSRGAQRGAEG